MADFYAVEASGDEGLEPFPPTSVSRVRPYRQRTGLVRDRDRVLNGQFGLWDEGTPVRSEVSPKRVAEIVNRSAGHQRTRDVWTSHRATIRLMQYIFECDLDAK